MKSTYTVADQRLLEHLFRIHGKPEKGYGNNIKYYRKITKIFNSMTTGVKRSPNQVRNYHGYKKKRAKLEEPKISRRASNKSSTRTKKSTSTPLPKKEQLAILPPPSSSNEITCKNIRSLSSPAKKSRKSNATAASADVKEDFRSLADDLPKSWEYTEISAGFLGGSESSTSLKLGNNVDRDEPHIFDDIDDLSSGRAVIATGGMSSDLVNILTEQARQHHKMKMKLLNEKFRKASEVYKMKMYILENELEMKRKEHEKKMDVLMQKYRKVKDGYQQ